jgi:putative endonuclease
MGPNKREVGGRAENTALDFLVRGGYKILERNFRSPFGELDIIARDGGYTVFIEVKFRETGEYGAPQEAVDRRKQRHIVKSALAYIKRHRLEGTDVRFDVIAVGPAGTEIEHIKSAFMAEQRYSW